MSRKYVYRIFRTTEGGETLAAEGTGAECAAQLGISSAGLYALINRAEDGVDRRFRVETIVRKFGPDALLAARQWDAFTEPLRKKYGITRYKEAEHE